MSASKKIILRSKDDQFFEVDEEVAKESPMIRGMIDGKLADNEIRIPKVAGQVLSKVIEYCEMHVDTAKGEDRVGKDDLESWDAEFVKVDHGILLHLLVAADYLGIQGLLDLTISAAARMIEGKSPEEIRKLFNIENDLTKEEEERIRRDIEWAVE